MQRLRLILVFAALFALAFATALFLTQDGEKIGGDKTSGGAPSIGGPFSLTDHTGQRVTDRDFRGKLMLVTFGYTYCPDICPTELQTVAQALDLLGPEADKIAPLFISVDPNRDNLATLSTYVATFSPRIRGLTGAQSDIASVTKAYRVYVRKVESSATYSDYTIDHSAFIYLMDEQGQYVTHFKFDDNAKAMAETLHKRIAAMKKP